MARGRMLSCSLGTSRRFNDVAKVGAELTEFAQLLFTLLVPHADDFGRLSADSFTVKAKILPASARTIEEFDSALLVLHAVNLITLYEIEGEFWLQISKFDEHQWGLTKRTKSRIPEVPGNSRESVKFTELQESLASRARAELKRTELKRTEDLLLVQLASSRRPASAVPVNGQAAASPPGHAMEIKRNQKIITKLAFEAIDAPDAPTDFPSLKADVKSACARHKILYDAEVAGAALESAMAVRGRR